MKSTRTRSGSSVPAALGSLLLALALNACATSGVVPDSKRDTSGQFDGQWRIEVLDTPNIRQSFGQWVMRCEGMAHGFNVSVKDGTMTTSFSSRRRNATANVDSDGNFLLVAPTGANSRETAGSSASIQRGTITHYISGNLGGEQPTGNFRAGVEQFAGNGCRTKTRFTRR